MAHAGDQEQHEPGGPRESRGHLGDAADTLVSHRASEHADNADERPEGAQRRAPFCELHDIEDTAGGGLIHVP